MKDYKLPSDSLHRISEEDDSNGNIAGWIIFGALCRSHNGALPDRFRLHGLLGRGAMSFDGRKPKVDPAAPIRAKLQRKRRRFVASREAMLDEKQRNREMFRSRGTSVYSAAYRKHLPTLPEMTKSELRNMLADAFRNTASIAGY